MATHDEVPRQKPEHREDLNSTVFPHREENSTFELRTHRDGQGGILQASHRQGALVTRRGPALGPAGRLPCPDCEWDEGASYRPGRHSQESN